MIGLGLGLGLAFLASRVMPQSSAPEAAVAPTEQLASASVTVARSQTTPIRQTLSTSGTVEAFDLLSVSPRANGLQVLAVNVRTGDYVNAGDVLAVLDSAVLQAQVDQAMAQISEAQAQVAQTQAQAAQAQAALAEAQDSFNRYSTLFKQGAISEEALTSRRTQLVTAEQTVGAAAAAVDSAQSSVTRRQAEVDRAVTELQQTQVLAPESGIIAEKTATVGSVASAGTPLFQIISGEQLELSVQVPQTQLAQVNIGTPVLITSSADASLKLQGSVRSIDPTLNATREATVKVSLNKGESGSRLRAGMFLKADIVIDSRPGVVLPAEAVQPQADGRFLVYVLNENQTVTAKLVTVGDRIAANGSTPAKLEITSGLAANVPVVVEGAAYLQDGDKVDVVSDMATGADS
ncbi:MAG: efflux RND transporter periplasmic adaptor subunit [Phormidesmis sp. RL_2_1]|nr:efflux RND transporter periplasmic adaptor subunit [Phormidesmis sp. RL_2_1]